jgi:hypothetical protein
MQGSELTREVIGSAIEVHRELGPGKREAAYERALAHETAQPIAAGWLANFNTVSFSDGLRRIACSARS